MKPHACCAKNHNYFGKHASPARQQARHAAMSGRHAGEENECPFQEHAFFAAFTVKASRTAFLRTTKHFTRIIGKTGGRS